MTEDEARTSNTADSGSQVGIQAEYVHNSNVYFVGPDASPEEQFRVGAKYLDDGVPTKAKELIEKAIAHGLDNSKVRFHWVMAMLSKRSYRDLSNIDREQLARLPEWMPIYVDDVWRSALTAVWTVLEDLDDPDPDRDQGAAIKELQELPDKQRDMVAHHLDLVVTGGMRDYLWATMRQRARAAQYDRDRRNRVWAYFQPDPAEPRVEALEEEEPLGSGGPETIIASGLLVVAVGSMTWSALTSGSPVLALALLGLSVASGFVGVHSGIEWRYRRMQLITKERAHSDRGRSNRPLEPGFPRQVRHSFDYYTHKYAPATHPERWFIDTVGIRTTLSDEIARSYDDGETKEKTIRWLIRYHVADIRNQWRAGHLFDYRRQYHVPLRMKLRCSVGWILLFLSITSTGILAFHVHPLLTAVTAFVAVGSGWHSGTRLLDMSARRRQQRQASRERAELLSKRRDVHERWRKKLLATRPTEDEMERWLDADKVTFIDEVLRNYRLPWRDIIAHVIIQAPTRSYERARVKGGPWRYSRYDLRLFLITDKGVREVSTQLDFRQATRMKQERSAYRFDAVSSVQVDVTGNAAYALNLTLTNGPSRSIRIVDAQPGSTEDASAVSELNLDATGFEHALRILEGIAAEGKDWITRDTARSRS